MIAKALVTRQYFLHLDNMDIKQQATVLHLYDSQVFSIIMALCERVFDALFFHGKAFEV